MKKMKELERWVRKTLAYLESDKGKENWKANTARGYGFEMNLCAAIQTATRLIFYERIIAVACELKTRWASAQRMAA